MLLTVLIISGTILGATTIAGILMVNQIRQTTNVASSFQAIFAADAGLEWELYKMFKNPDYAKPLFSIPADFETESLTSAEQIEFRSVGCAGAPLENLTAGQCARSINRSLQLRFVLVE